MKINGLEYFDLDLDIYNNIFNKSPRLRLSVNKNKSIIFGFDSLSEDIYLSLFKAKPVINDVKDIDIRYRLNRMMIENLLETDEIELLRKNTSLSYFNAVLSTEILGSELVENYNKLLEKSRDFRELEKSYKLSVRHYLDSQDNTEKNDLAKLVDQSVEKMRKYMSRDNLFYKTVDFTYKEFLTMSNTIKFWGLDDTKLNSQSYEEKIAVASELRKFKKIDKLSEMVGRFRQSASDLQKQRSKEEGQEIYDVHLGDEIHKVLPSEKLFLANEKTKSSFYKKYYQKELLSYKHKNRRISSKGPIICCIDTSTSMEGDHEIWSKSVAMALMDIAHKQRRDFVAILFSYRVGEVIEFNKNRVEPKKIYNLATSFYGSGTNFVEPLTEAVKLINRAKYKYADIVFITDGEAPVDDEFIEEFNKQKQEKEFRMITVNVSNKIEEALDSINDVQMLLSDLTDETVEETNKVLFSI